MTLGAWRYAASGRDDDTGGLVVLAAGDDQDGWRVVSERQGIPGATALALHPSGRAVYLTSTADGGSVVGLAIAPDGSLSALGSQTSGGESPCAVRVDPSGRFLVTTNYDGGTLAVHPIGSDLTLRAPTDVIAPSGFATVGGLQKPAHPHQAVFAPDSEIMLVTDLGRDALYTYRITPEGLLLPSPERAIAAPAGSGPRHLAFRPDGAVVVSDELTSTVSVYRRQRHTGDLTWSAATSTIESRGGAKNYPSELVLSSDGHYCYVGNRGHDTIGVISMEGDRLKLIQEAAAGGRWPQHLALIDGRLCCALRDDDVIVAMTVDEATGRLGTPLPVAHVPAVSWIAAGPSGAGSPVHRSQP